MLWAVEARTLNGARAVQRASVKSETLPWRRRVRYQRACSVALAWFEDPSVLPPIQETE